MKLKFIGLIPLGALLSCGTVKNQQVAEVVNPYDNKMINASFHIQKEGDAASITLKGYELKEVSKSEAMTREKGVTALVFDFLDEEKVRVNRKIVSHPLYPKANSIHAGEMNENGTWKTEADVDVVFLNESNIRYIAIAENIKRQITVVDTIAVRFK